MPREGVGVGLRGGAQQGGQAEIGQGTSPNGGGAARSPAAPPRRRTLLGFDVAVAHAAAVGVGQRLGQLDAQGGDRGGGHRQPAVA